MLVSLSDLVLGDAVSNSVAEELVADAVPEETQRERPFQWFPLPNSYQAKRYLTLKKIPSTLGTTAKRFSQRHVVQQIGGNFPHPVNNGTEDCCRG